MLVLRYLKSIGVFTFVGGVGFISYEVISTYKILNKGIDTSVIDITEPKLQQLARTNRKYVDIKPKRGRSPSFFDKFWDSVTFSYAKKLLTIAQSEDLRTRKRAVDALSKIKTLDDWHYSLLAHMLDARTAVGLARSEDVDLKYFLKPPNRYVYYNHERIVSWMKHFLTSLEKCSKHPCMSYFISKAFVNPQEVGRMVEHDISSVELKQCIQSADDILPLCVQSILHHSTIENHARDIVQNNGLPLLMELYQRYKDNKDIMISLVKIVGNISCHNELLQDLYRSGWVGILANFLKHDDIRISGPAARALANLDADDNSDITYERKIYLLHPVNRNDQKGAVDVILVHGLLGGVFFTWRQRSKVKMTTGFLGKKPKDETISCSDDCRSSDPLTREFMNEIAEQNKLEWNQVGKDFEIVYDDCPKNLNEKGPYSCPGECLCSLDDEKYSQCWPKDWLPSDCSNIRIIGINYESNLSFWTPMCPVDKSKSTLNERSEDFINKLISAGVGDRPVIWLTHSMGGLLVKNILVKASQNANENVRKLSDNTKGIVFYSTPHKGTHIASLNQTTSLFVWPSIEVRELKEGSPALLSLHNEFLDLLRNKNIKVISFVETELTTITPLKLNFRFVPVHSSKLHFGEHYEVALDHLGICKPLNRHSFLYQRVLLLIKDVKQGKSVL